MQLKVQDKGYDCKCFIPFGSPALVKVICLPGSAVFVHALCNQTNWTQESTTAINRARTSAVTIISILHEDSQSTAIVLHVRQRGLCRCAVWLPVWRIQIERNFKNSNFVFAKTRAAHVQNTEC